MPTMLPASEFSRRRQIEHDLAGPGFTTALPQPNWITPEYSEFLGGASRGGVRVAGGVRGAKGSVGVPGLRQTRPYVGSMSLADDGGDPDFSRSMRSLALQRAHTENEILDQQRRGGMLDLDMATFGSHNALRDDLLDRGPDFDLASGRAGARAAASGDIARREGSETARAQARSFMDPTVAAARSQAVDEQERLLTARYGREADAAAKVEAARLAADARTRSADTAARGGLTREAIRGLLKSRELQALIGGQGLDPQRSAEVEDLLWREASGGTPAAQNMPDTGVDDVSLRALIAGAQGNAAGAEQLAGVWDQLTPQQQAMVRAAMGRR